MGMTEPEDERDEVIQFSEPRRGTYKKLIVREGRLVGAMLMGDISKAAYPDAGVRPRQPAARRAAVAAVRSRHADATGDAGRDAGRDPGMQLQRRHQGGDRRVRGRRCAHAEGGDGCHPRRHGLRLVQDPGGRGRRLVLRRCRGGGSLGALLRALHPAGQARSGVGHTGTGPEIGVRRVRRPDAGRPARCGEQAGAGIVARDSVGRCLRRRARRAIHQRSCARQHPEGRHLFRRAGDARRGDARQTSCCASPRWR